MKLQLDTVKKTISIEQDVKLEDLFITLNSILPENEWKNYTLKTNVPIYWEVAPIQVFPAAPVEPFYVSPGTAPDRNYPWIISSTDDTTFDTTFKITEGTYTIDANLNGN